MKMAKETELEKRLEHLKLHKGDAEFILKAIDNEIERIQDDLDNLRINRDSIEGDSDYVAE